MVPGVLGPVLDGSDYAEIPDTDNGRGTGNRTWDRALGPLQLLPASWRVAGMDADGDGRRDPQNVYDAAGAAMVYLCDGGRDLGTRKGLEEAVLAYNHSRDYLRLVLAWKTVFDTADVTGLGSTPPMGAWAAQSILAPQPSKAADGSTGCQAPAPASARTQAIGRRGRAATDADADGDLDADRSAAAADPTAGPTVVPTASDPPAPSAKPDPKPDKPGDKPDKPGDKPTKPGDKPSDTPLPTCPTDEPTPTDDPTCRTHLLPGRARGADRDADSHPVCRPEHRSRARRPVRHRDGDTCGGGDSLATAWFRDGLVPRPPQPPAGCCWFATYGLGLVDRVAPLAARPPVVTTVARLVELGSLHGEDEPAARVLRE